MPSGAGLLGCLSWWKRQRFSEELQRQGSPMGALNLPRGGDELPGWERGVSTPVLLNRWDTAAGPGSFSSPHRPPLPPWPEEAHLEADTHVRRHDDLVAFAVHLRAPQELALGGRDVVLAAVVAQLDALLHDQKRALGHVLVRRLRGVAEESFCDFLGGRSVHRMGERKAGVCARPRGQEQRTCRDTAGVQGRLGVPVEQPLLARQWAAALVAPQVLSAGHAAPWGAGFLL